MFNGKEKRPYYEEKTVRKAACFVFFSLLFYRDTCLLSFASFSYHTRGRCCDVCMFINAAFGQNAFSCYVEIF